MKKALLGFADSLLSREQMKKVRGGCGGSGGSGGGGCSADCSGTNQCVSGDPDRYGCRCETNRVCTQINYK